MSTFVIPTADLSNIIFLVPQTQLTVPVQKCTTSPSLRSLRSSSISTQELISRERYSQPTTSSPAPLTDDETDSKLGRTFDKASPDSNSSLGLSDIDLDFEQPTDTSTNNSHEEVQYGF